MKFLSKFGSCIAMLTFFCIINGSQEFESKSFEKFEELPQDLKKVIVSFAAQSIHGNSLAEIITNITNLLSINKEWSQYLNSPRMTNILIQELETNLHVRTLLNELHWNSSLPKLDEEDFKIILLVLLNTSGTYAQLQALQKLDAQNLQAIFNKLIFYFAYILPPLDSDPAAQATSQIIDTIITIEQRLIAHYIKLFGKATLSNFAYQTFLNKVKKVRPNYYNKLLNWF